MEENFRKKGRAMPRKRRRLAMRRILSLALAAVLAMAPTLEVLAATPQTHTVWLYDSRKLADKDNDPEHYFDGHREYLYSQTTYNKGDTMTFPDESELLVPEGCVFRGWYNRKIAPWGVLSDIAIKYDSSSVVQQAEQIFANYTLLRTDENTETLVDDFAETVTLNTTKMSNSEYDYRKWYQFTPEKTDQYQFTFAQTTVLGKLFDGDDPGAYVTGEMLAEKNASSAKVWDMELEKGKKYYICLWMKNDNFTQYDMGITFKASSTQSSVKEIKNLDITVENPSINGSIVYTGEEIRPKITLRDGEKVLTEGTHYKVTYANNIRPSDNNTKATVTIEAINHSGYIGSYKFNFYIAGLSQAPPNKPASPMTVDYNVKTVGDAPLPEGWEWQSNYRAKELSSDGKSVYGWAEYIGEDAFKYRTTAYRIDIYRSADTSAKAIDTLTITAQNPSAGGSVACTGAEIKPQITVKDGTKVLKEGTDYTVTYADNVKPGKATVTVNAAAGSGYTGYYRFNFTIKALDQDPPKKPASPMTVDYEVKTVGDAPLPDGWEWNQSDRTKSLKPDEPVEARVNYTATDAYKYQTTEFTILINRLPAVITGFSLSETAKTLKKGETFQLSLTEIQPPDAEDFSVDFQNIWSSNDSKVATVDKDGNVTAVSTGTAVITAKINNISRTCTVKVVNPLTAFTLNKNALSLKGGESEQLSLVTTPAAPDDYTITWSSTDPNVAAVDSNGLVTAAGSGTAEIKAEVNGISQTCTVTVANPLTAFTLNKETAELTAGNTETIYVASTVPADPDAYTITWSSTNLDVADVSEDGKITAKQEGTAEIKAEINGMLRTCTVTVKASTAQLTGIRITPEQMELKAGEHGVITVSPEPAGAVTGDITYEMVTGNDVVTLNTGTGTVTAVKTGSAEIKVTAGSFEKTCRITVSNPVKGFALDRNSLIMQIGGKEKLSVGSVIPASPDSYTVEWESSQPDIAGVDGNGNVEAKAAGTAVITAKINGISRSCTVTVEKPQAVPVSGITLDVTEKTIEKGETFKINIQKIEPETADNKEVEWVSGDPLVATVAADGTVTGVAGGQTSIMAVAKDESGVSASCKVTVNAPVTDFTLSKTSLTMRAGGREQLTVMPETAQKAVSWKSSSPDIASVDADGVVEAKAAGLAVISADIGGNTQRCVVQVIGDSEQISVSRIVLDVTEKTIQKGETFKINILQIMPDTADNKEVEWKSSNPSVAAVAADGTVTGAAAGQAEITAAAKDGSGTSASCMVTVEEESREKDPDKPDVTPPGTGDIKATGLKITGQTKKVAPGKKIALTANVYPENAANKQVVWSVSNAKYASVNSRGVVTVKKAAKGKKVTVTAVSAQDNSIKAVYQLTVMKKAVKKIKLTGKKTLKVGKSMKIKAGFTPSKGISKELTWTSSNKKIAVVNSKGKVTAKAKGRVKITAKAKDGSGKKASIKIQIK